LAVLAANGCARAWRPSQTDFVAARADAVLELRDYAPEQPGKRVYQRRNLRNPDEPAQPYPRRPAPGALREGLLAGRGVPGTGGSARFQDDSRNGVAEYLNDSAEARKLRGELWPMDAGKTSVAFFLEFDPPLVDLPARVAADSPFAQRCRVRCYNRDAELWREGTAIRRTYFEGLESISAGGHPYVDCARLRIDTRIRLPWGPRVNLATYLWLAPKFGEVRRVEQISGLALLVHFDEVYEYELIEPIPKQAGESGKKAAPPTTRPERGEPTTRPSDAAPHDSVAWSRCAVFLDRSVPHPRLGGMMIDLAPASGQEQITANADAMTPRARSPSP